VLDHITQNLTDRALFWLDGHYSGGMTARGKKDSPILEEVNAIFRYKQLGHVLLVDDADSFNGQGDYPTIEELTMHIKKYNSKYEMALKDNILRYTVD
jgi:hypothetical protein